MHDMQVLWHWATSPALTVASLTFEPLL
jgi:hypothetical protein